MFDKGTITIFSGHYKNIDYCFFDIIKFLSDDINFLYLDSSSSQYKYMYNIPKHAMKIIGLDNVSYKERIPENLFRAEVIICDPAWILSKIELIGTLEITDFFDYLISLKLPVILVLNKKLTDIVIKNNLIRYHYFYNIIDNKTFTDILTDSTITVEQFKQSYRRDKKIDDLLD